MLFEKRNQNLHQQNTEHYIAASCRIRVRVYQINPEGRTSITTTTTTNREKKEEYR